MSILKIVGAPS